jgi:hypothetical protein
VRVLGTSEEKIEMVNSRCASVYIYEWHLDMLAQRRKGILCCKRWMYILVVAHHKHAADRGCAIWARLVYLFADLYFGYVIDKVCVLH